ncbi:hypothetical protein TA3x_000467 [Tundrisphaera sp. TA3]|uniref:hypothetical protein n=1 Tax=Tundrisphaera sp. TA3 TaxID=3435775 RepID=UPI003EBD1284
MPVNSFTIGKDISFTLVTSKGTLVIDGLTEYSIKPKNTILNHKDLNGEQEHGVIPDGWDISIKLDRKNPALDNYFAQAEADYYAGINNPAGTIIESIQEKNGSVSQFRYTKVIVVFDDAGGYKGDSLVPQSLMCHATRRIKVA